MGYTNLTPAQPGWRAVYALYAPEAEPDEAPRQLSTRDVACWAIDGDNGHVVALVVSDVSIAGTGCLADAVEASCDEEYVGIAGPTTAAHDAAEVDASVPLVRR